MLLLASKREVRCCWGKKTRYPADELDHDHVQSAWDSGALKQALVTGGEPGTGPGQFFCISKEYQKEYKHPVAHKCSRKFYCDSKHASCVRFRIRK